MKVAVADDERAYVGVSVCEKPSGGNNGSVNSATPLNVTVENRLPTQLTVTDVRGARKPVDATVDPGDRAHLVVPVDTHLEKIELTGKTAGTTLTVTREINERGEGDCPNPASNGNGNGKSDYPNE